MSTCGGVGRSGFGGGVVSFGGSGRPPRKATSRRCSRASRSARASESRRRSRAMLSSRATRIESGVVSFAARSAATESSRAFWRSESWRVCSSSVRTTTTRSASAESGSRRSENWRGENTSPTASGLSNSTRSRREESLTATARMRTGMVSCTNVYSETAALSRSGIVTVSQNSVRSSSPVLLRSMKPRMAYCPGGTKGSR